MLKTMSFQKIKSGDCKYYEVKNGSTKRLAMLGTILPNSQVLHDEVRKGHNIEIYYLNPKSKEIEEHEIIFLSS